MSDLPAASNGFKKWVYVGGKTGAPPASAPAASVPQNDVPAALSGSYRASAGVDAAAAVERAGRILAAATTQAQRRSAPAPETSPEASSLLSEIDQTIARLASL